MPALLRRMTARSTDERGRVSSPLELLFDLTFVVAVSQAAAGLAGAAEKGNPLAGLPAFAMIFFAIWWAWMNFTWFASAYDTDDVPYRVLTLVQMAGSLVIAAGVHVAFQGGDLTVITIGYAIARLALVAQWLRAAKQHPEGRGTTLRYAVLITVVQALWIARLFVPWGQDGWVFVILAIAELSVPPIANRAGGTTWHPHHIAERYGLFVIILLGESVSAATIAFSQTVVTPRLIGIGVGGLVILFGLWWAYFTQSAGEGLENRRDRALFWGYGHYFLFAALTAVGAGLELAVAASGGDLPLSDRIVAFSVAAPVALVLVMVWALNMPLDARLAMRPEVTAFAAALVLVAAVLTPFIGLPIALGAIGGVLVLAIATTYIGAGARVA